MRLIGLALVILGVLAAVYGGFTYVEDSSSVDLGVAEVQVNDEETVHIPLWLGIGAAGVGALLVVADRRKRTS